MQEKSTRYFTERIERLKFELGLTDEELSKRIKISRRMIWLIKTGKANISRKTLWKLGEAEREAGISGGQDTVFQGLEKGAGSRKALEEREAKLLERLDNIATEIREIRRELRRK